MAQNEVLFREVNGHVETVAAPARPNVPSRAFCECANADCTFQSSYPIGLSEHIRSDPTQFVVLPQHCAPRSRISSSRKPRPAGSYTRPARPANTLSASIHGAGEHSEQVSTAQTWRLDCGHEIHCASAREPRECAAPVPRRRWDLLDRAGSSNVEILVSPASGCNRSQQDQPTKSRTSSSSTRSNRELDAYEQFCAAVATAKGRRR